MVIIRYHTADLTATGGTITTDGADTIHTFTASGTFEVTSIPPVAAFSGTPTSGVAPLSVTFTDSSTNTPTSWAWTFGDGNTATTQNPSNTYQNAGNYTVELTATNAAGSDAETKTGYITVTAATQTKTGGKGDNPKKRKKLHLPVKPLGLLDRPKKAPEGRTTPDERVSQGLEIQSEIASRLAREFSEETLQAEEAPPIDRMSIAEIESEIGSILRKKLQSEEEVLLLMMMSA